MRGEYQCPSNQPDGLVSSGNICIPPRRIHLVLLEEDCSDSCFLVIYFIYAEVFNIHSRLRERPQRVLISKTHAVRSRTRGLLGTVLVS